MSAGATISIRCKVDDTKSQLKVVDGLLTNIGNKSTQTISLNTSPPKIGKQLKKEVNEAKKAAREYKYSARDTNYKGNAKESDEEPTFWTPLKKFAVWIRSLHIYGITPLTRGLAKLGGTMLGSFIHPVTLAVTAIMAISVAVKHFIDKLKDNSQIIKQRGSIIKDTAKQNINNFKKQREQLQKLADAFKKLNKEATTRTTQADLQKTLIAQIHDLLPEEKIEIDQATGKLKNFEQLQAKVFKKLGEKTIQADKDQQAANDLILDALLNEGFNAHPIDNKWRLFTNKGGDQSGSIGPTNEDFIQEFGKYWDTIIEALDILPGNPLAKWITQNDDPNKGKIRSLDLNKLRSANYKEQREFFRQMSQYVNPEQLAKISEIIKVLDEQVALDEHILDSMNPLQKIYDQTLTVDESLAGVLKKEGELSEQRIKNDEEYNKAIKEAKYEELSLEDKLAQKKQDQLDTQTKLNQLEKKRFQSEETIKGLGIVKNGEGLWSTDTLQKMLQNNEALRGYREDTRKAQEQMKRQINNESAKYLGEMQNILMSAPWIAQGREPMNASEQKFLNDYNTAQSNFNNVSQVAYQNYQNKLTDLRQNIYNIQGEELKQFNDELQKIENASKFLDEENKIEEQFVAVRNQSLQLTKTINSLQKEIADKAREAIKKEEDFWAGLLNPQLKKMFEGTQFSQQMRYNELAQQLLAQRGEGATLSEDDKQRLRNIAQLEYLSSMDLGNSSKYSVKTNDLAARGGFASSVVVSGEKDILRDQLKQNRKMARQLELISNTDSKILSTITGIGVIQ